MFFLNKDTGYTLLVLIKSLFKVGASIAHTKKLIMEQLQRDGFTTSLWQAGMQGYAEQKKKMPLKADVVVIGGGITGITTALKLQKAGKQCVVIEAKNIGFGTTGGTTAHLNTFMDTPYYTIKNNFGENGAQLVAQIARKSIEQIKRFVAEYTIECGFTEKTAYIFSQNEEQSNELEKIKESAKEVGVAMDYTPALPIPISFNQVVEVPSQAQMHSTRYLFGIAKAFEEAGGQIIQNCRAANVKVDGTGTIVETTLGNIATGHVVYATHIPPGVNLLHFCCAPYRSYAIAFKLADGKYPDALVYDLYDPYHYYRTQEVNGQQYLIAGGEDHKTAHEKDTNSCFNRLEEYVAGIFNVESVAFRWSSQYFEPADGLPYIGHLPGNPPNVYVATGFGGNGMIYGTAAAEVLADLICNGTSEYEDLFNPSRVKPVAGFENFVKEAADVVGVFIGGKLDVSKMDPVIELNTGEAKVIKHEGSSMAVYKDEAGQVHAVNPSCPHIKCNVAWNTAEKSWDCPCHGSRFSYTGELLTAPARKNLDVIDMSEINRPNE